MKQDTYRKALFAIPLAAAAFMATGALAQEGRGGRDGGGRAESSERSSGGGERSRDAGERRGDDGGKSESRRGDGDRGDRADRGGRGDRFDGPRRRFSGGDGRRGDWRRGRRYNWGPGIAFYFNDGYYYGECNWLKRRARLTGNPVWLRRYARCRNAV